MVCTLVSHAEQGELASPCLQYVACLIQSVSLKPVLYSLVKSHDTASSGNTSLQHVMLKLQSVSTGCHAEQSVLVTGVQRYQVGNPEAELLCI